MYMDVYIYIYIYINVYIDISILLCHWNQNSPFVSRTSDSNDDFNVNDPRSVPQFLPYDCNPCSVTFIFRSVWALIRLVIITIRSCVFGFAIRRRRCCCRCRRRC